ncbi:hypothetical protein AGABI1DRAFT_41417 [Agaricus bisporus var. burnettii JB137-S8]|uniref:SH3 domain-containing protein n=1 Tax=Agaricus bisporus var. burnettii (strain JB137-S8 / ATCC MYA-4627 / FGSC 10392) TaxID=597362 RepID=K5VW49_AGABU|nr:uncharacterized protein AGABI1DRAFT_41417 [Agaricus bisporus var. burnettii JB137-S8]EKM78699.1 hypothetical protein AGABI1DRAFT_41417 [Agaricus bisporus var. burnettii JB137-S8]
MPIIALFQRNIPTPASAASSNAGIPALYIIGFCVAGAGVLGIAIWLGIYLYRKKVTKKRHDRMGPAFLSVRGLVKEGEPHPEKNVSSSVQPPGSFSRNNINSQIILPSKTLDKISEETNDEERDKIMAYHRQSNNFPKPFSFALSNPNRSSGVGERLSVAGSFAPSSRFSVFSAASSYNESLASTDSKGNPGRSLRKVRQTFNPVLPDELVVIAGEQLMILQSFDDGWCVVGRESVPRPKPLFGGIRSSRIPTPTSSNGPGNDVELGMIPAWCFLKEVKGLRAERPVRSTSLGVTVQLEGQETQRNDFISWSNF